MRVDWTKGSARAGGQDRSIPFDVCPNLGAAGKRPALDRRHPEGITPVQGTRMTFSALRGLHVGSPAYLPLVTRVTKGADLAALPGQRDGRRPRRRTEQHWMHGFQHLAKVRVAGSNPVVRSKESPGHGHARGRNRPLVARPGAPCTTFAPHLPNFFRRSQLVSHCFHV